MGNFVVIVDFEAKEGAAEEVLALVSENARNSVEREPGCLQFDVMQSPDNPDRFVLFEVYQDAAAFEAHGKSAHVQEFLARARPKLGKTTMHKLARRTHPTKR